MRPEQKRTHTNKERGAFELHARKEEKKKNHGAVPLPTNSAVRNVEQLVCVRARDLKHAIECLDHHQCGN